jgi:hypothetical protein
MSWSVHAREELSAGRSVVVRPRGDSMKPRIRSGASVLLEPIKDPKILAVDDIVFVKVRGRWYLHRVAAADSTRVQIANARGRVNGWASRQAVLGVATRINNSGGSAVSNL